MAGHLTVSGDSVSGDSVSGDSVSGDSVPRNSGPATDNPYDGIADDLEDHRWAFGTGFQDPLAGVDATVPDGVDGVDLGAYCTMLGDDALILSHRLQEWVARAPELEEETALANVALDLLGQARLLLARAGQADGSGRGEDDFAFRRPPAQFRNVLLTEVANDDFGALMARLFLFTTWRLAVFQSLRSSRDPVLAAIAAKAVNELTYHRDYAAQWVVRLGDGTELSARRMSAGLLDCDPFVEELFVATDVELRLVQAGVAADPSVVRTEFDAIVDQVRHAGGLGRPAVPGGAAVLAGRVGRHTVAFAPLLEELQSVARAHPGATW